LIISLIAGAGPWIAEHLSQPVNQFLRTVAAVFGVSLLIHLFFWAPFFLLHKIFSRVSGWDVEA
jgi:hypothetical protein